MTGRTRFLPLALLALLTGGPLLSMPSLAEVSFVQGQGNASNVNVAQLSASFSSAQQSADLNVVMIGWRDSTAIQSVTDTAGNTYVQAVGQTALSGMGSHAIYYAKNIAAAAAGANTVIVQFASPVSKPDLRIAEYSGVDTTNPFEAGVAATGTGVTMDSGPLTISNANDLLVAGNCAQFFTELTGDPGYAVRVATAPGSRILQDRIATTPGPYNATAMQDTSGGWIIQLAAFKAAGGGGDIQPPTTPTNVSASAVSSTQINVTWTASTDNIAVTNYMVERCEGVSCSNWLQIATPTTTSYNDTGRTGSTTYRYRVRAQDAAPNFSDFSSIGSATTPGPDTQAPTTPINVSATAVSSTQINLTWTASIDNVAVTNYLVERCQGASCSNYAQIATPTTTSYNDTDRTASTSYRYRVRAQDAVPNFSLYSSVVSATTLAGSDTQAPTTPTNLGASAVSSTQINLSWTASTDNVAVTGYLVERCQGAGCSNFAQIATPTTTSYNDTGRSPSTSYSYRVRAQDAVPNFSAYSATASATTSGAGDIQAPTAPSALTGGAISNSQVNLSWSASTDNVGVTGYRIERCTGASCSNFSQIGTPPTTSYSDTGLSAATTYRYRVRATDAADNLSDYSDVAAVTTHIGSGTSTTTYTYDAAGRLIRAVSSTGRMIEYEYDANGNITVIERQ